MKSKILPWFAWLMAAVIVLYSLFQMGQRIWSYDRTTGLATLLDHLAWLALPIVFAIPAALIVFFQPRNLIGWLLMLPALVTGLPGPAVPIFDPNIPPTPSFLTYVYLWFDNWNWILLIFPILLIPLLFPDGRPPSPRWRWVIYYAVLKFFFLIFLITFAKSLAPSDEHVTWSLNNPIGFIDSSILDGPAFNIPWTISLLALTIFCVAALFVRFRSANRIERTQIKWLLYACAVFGFVYFVLAIVADSISTPPILDILFAVSLMGLPLAIATAVLRYKLFDIDIIIRKTLVYTLLTGLLALTFFGSVIVLQYLFSLLFGQQSQVAIIISTLGIAALFTPLRSRVQAFINRRFFRQKYDAEKLLATFARKTRDETNLDALSSSLLGVVDETIQPQTVELWVKSNK
jgi:hypothetical protein